MFDDEATFEGADNGQTLMYIPLELISEHPENIVYSMDESSISELSRSIEENGLTDLPVVRQLDSTSYQMISGHRRLAAYRMLARDEDAYSSIPCRVLTDVSDSRAVMMLHAANYFVRELTVTERAKASQALGVEAQRRRNEDPSLKGARLEDIKSIMLFEQTGKRVSGKTIRRQEVLAEKMDKGLVDGWKEMADKERISVEAVDMLIKLPEEHQTKLLEHCQSRKMGKQAITAAIRLQFRNATSANAHLAKSLAELRAFESDESPTFRPADLEVLQETRNALNRIIRNAKRANR